MSNKEQLQTNNDALDGYIARINAAKEVASTLPRAGNIETCTLSLVSNRAIMDFVPTVYFVDGNTSYINHEDGYFEEPGTKTVTTIKNSLIHCVHFGSTGIEHSGNIIVASDSYHSSTDTVYFISGDATLVL